MLNVHDRYIPPKGGVHVPHPRTPADILLRTTFIHLTAALAYAHLCHLLRWRKPHGAATLPLILPILFTLFPELILLQFGFWAVPTLLVGHWRRLSGRRLLGELPREFRILGRGGRRWLGMHCLGVSVNGAVLCAAFSGYKNRLRMRYHEADYVGNLGLDHRNGWLAAGGLVTVGLSLLLLLTFAVVRSGVLEADDDNENGKMLARIEEEDLSSSDSEKGSSQEGLGSYTPPIPSSSDGEVDEKILELENEPTVSSTSFFTLDWTSLSELLYAASIHQFLLKITNHFVPLTAYLRSWPLLLGSSLLIWYSYKKCGAKYETIGRWFAVVAIVVTVVTHIGTDLEELYDVTHGTVERYNYRWAVKDWFSAKSAPD